MKTDELTEDDVRILLSREIAAAGSQIAWSRKTGISQPLISDVLAGRRRPGVMMRYALSLERVVRYRRI